jgi:hypothetical protein
MGEVTYERYYYKKTSGGYAFLLDEAMGIESDYGLVSENLAEAIVCECTDKSYRKGAGSISSYTGQFITAMAAWGVIRRFGEKLGWQTERLKELDERGVTGQLGNIASKVVFGEMDDVWLSMQKAKRRTKGAPAGDGDTKTGKKPIHVGTAYTGWTRLKDDRYKTLNKIAYASFGSAAEFGSAFESLLRQVFDMDGIERRVMNGDGASWIKTIAAENDAILQLDPFHRSRAITRAIHNKGDRKAVGDAIKDRDIGKVLTIITDLIAKAEDQPARKKLGDLFKYFHNNKDSLLTWQERGVELPTPPAGVLYRNLGIQEPTNCDLITQRMKHRKGSWSIDGANNMARILCFKNTIGLDTVMGLLPKPPEAENSPEPLSAAKTPLYDGEGYDGSWLYAKMPFEEVMVTNGRKVIQKLLGQRAISDLSFI